MKNLNLENFGVQEMDAREMENVDGGILPLLALAVEVVFFGAAADIILDFDHYRDVSKKGLARGAAAAH
jgi:lactobin A/cerein 7B family class IIb bacteriocin